MKSTRTMKNIEQQRGEQGAQVIISVKLQMHGSHPGADRRDGRKSK